MPSVQEAELEFERILESHRVRFREHINKEYEQWLQNFQELERWIIDASIRHFERKEFHIKQMAAFLIESCRWPNFGLRAQTPPNTVSSYICPKGKIGYLFDWVGRGRYRINGVCIHLVRMTRSYLPILLEPEADAARLPCGCHLMREPNMAVSINHCKEHCVVKE